jgi:glycosyltransferase involved in cell wall biosynthesis
VADGSIRGRQRVSRAGLPKSKPASTPARDSRLRVLVATHSHPAMSKGGAENAAHQLFTSLSALPGTEAWLLGCLRDGTFARSGPAITQPYSDREYLYTPTAFDWIKFANRDPRFPREFEELLKTLRPTIAHFHHYAHFGVETFMLVKRALPECRLIVTLHEYLAICNHYGQMVTKPDLHLCRAAGLTECHRCFPELPPSDLFLRQRYIQGYFEFVDHFISPSQFLADRYVAWGIPAEKMSVIENLIPPAEAAAAPAQLGAGDILRIGFFGQMSELKGIGVLLDAAAHLERADCDDVSFEIFGDYRGQPEAFRETIVRRLESLGRNVHFHGPYDHHDVDRLMQSVDAVLMPSIWWENSPLVIQEAFRNRRPVICSDIGGMAEKVRDGVDGFHFRAGNSLALAALLQRLRQDRSLITGLHATMRVPPAAEAIRDAHVQLYRSI